jgi:aspartate/methionine/tyrosine aminotransferase
MQIANRGAIRPFEVMEAFREAAALEASGKHIIHLSLGQPAKKVPPSVLEAVTLQMHASSLGYTDARGTPALRARIAQYYHDTYGITIPIERIFITVGSSGAYFLALLAAFDAGKRLAIARPCYPAYPNMMEALGLTPVFLESCWRGRRIGHRQPLQSHRQCVECRGIGCALRLLPHASHSDDFG